MRCSFSGEEEIRRKQEERGRRECGRVKGWHLYKKLLRRFMGKLVLEKATVLSGILMESIFLPSPAGTIWKFREKRKSLCKNNCYLCKRTALERSKCEVSR